MGHRKKLGSEHSQLPSGPGNPAEPRSAAILVQSRGDISWGRGCCRAKGGPGESGLTVLTPGGRLDGWGKVVLGGGGELWPGHACGEGKRGGKGQSEEVKG